MEKDYIIFTIKDNGAGIPSEKLELLLKTETNVLSGGYGIRNVNKRIKTYYGSQYGLNISSIEGKETCVTVTIPRIKDNDIN